MKFFACFQWRNKSLEWILTSVWSKRFPSKRSIFWDVTPYSPVKVNTCFGGTFRFHLQYLRQAEQESNMKKAASRGLQSWWWRWHVRLERLLTSVELHDVILQIELFMRTAVRTWNSTSFLLSLEKNVLERAIWTNHRASNPEFVEWLVTHH
jgi:hypothetical protein